MRLKKWFERSFPGGYPVELFANLRGRLLGAPPRAEDLTRGLSREALTRSVGGAWSIQRNVGHLIDLERLWNRRITNYMEGSAELAAADLTNKATHEADHDDRELEVLLRRFRAVRLAFVQRVDELGTARLETVALHPRLREPMRAIDFLLFVAEHDDHHLARILELRRELGV